MTVLTTQGEWVELSLAPALACDLAASITALVAPAPVPVKPRGPRGPQLTPEREAAYRAAGDDVGAGRQPTLLAACRARDLPYRAVAVWLRRRAGASY